MLTYSLFIFPVYLRRLPATAASVPIPFKVRFNLSWVSNPGTRPVFLPQLSHLLFILTPSATPSPTGSAVLGLRSSSNATAIILFTAASSNGRLPVTSLMHQMMLLFLSASLILILDHTTLKGCRSHHELLLVSIVGCHVMVGVMMMVSSRV